MLKRTKIYLVLTLLVLTGFAGSLNSNSLSSKERSTLVNELKDSKKVFLQSVKGLSDRQLNYKTSGTALSIKELTVQLVNIENRLWQIAGDTRPGPAHSAKTKTIKLSDDQVMKLTNTVPSSIKTPGTPGQKKTMDELMHDFKTQRTSLLRFAKTTTDDLRSQVKELPFGAVDSYQLLLIIASRTSYVTSQVEQIKTNPNFPK
jgi:hypothetical protein